jgi:hypothetical protein
MSRHLVQPPSWPSTWYRAIFFTGSPGQEVREILDARGVRFEEKRMMGGLCVMVDGKMCLGVEKQKLMVRLDPEMYESALKRRGCVPMDFTGRPMRGFVFVKADGLASSRDLEWWIEQALEYNPKAISFKKKTGSNNRANERKRTLRKE